MKFVFILLVVFGQKWEDVTEKIPGDVTKAFFLRTGVDSCLAIFTGEGASGELRFSTGKGRKDVVIARKSGKVSYRSGHNGAALKASDPAFTYCVGKVKSAPEFTPELRDRFLGFGGIK